MRIKGGTHSRRIKLGSPPQYTNYLFHALAFGARVVRAVALQQVDNAPNAEARAQRDNEGLQSGDSGCEESHKSSISPGIAPGNKKSRRIAAGDALGQIVPKFIQKRPGRPNRHSSGCPRPRLCPFRPARPPRTQCTARWD